MDRGDDEVGNTGMLGDEGKYGNVVFVIIAVMCLVIAYKAGHGAGRLARRKWWGRHIGLISCL